MRDPRQPSVEDLDSAPAHGNVQGSVTVPDPREAPTTDPVDEVAPEHQAAATAAVAEAVALASEEAAVEAAEAVVVTAVAATRAVGRAAGAVARAKSARIDATDAALLADEEDARNAEQAHGTQAPETRAPDRAEAEEILAAAEERDSIAELRDATAEEHERSASLRSFLKQTPYTEGELEAGELRARRAAALARLASKADRVAAASDRARLSALLLASLQAGEVSSGSPSSESEVVAAIRHELRVPLIAILASVELLEEKLRGHPDPTFAELLVHATRAGDRMARMLEEVGGVQHDLSQALGQVDL